MLEIPEFIYGYNIMHSSKSELPFMGRDHTIMVHRRSINTVLLNTSCNSPINVACLVTAGRSCHCTLQGCHQFALPLDTASFVG